MRIHRMEHLANEFMVVFGGAYHCGFNCGFNIAEAVNYATLNWFLDLGNVQSCRCSMNSVKVPIEAVLNNLQKCTIGNI